MKKTNKIIILILTLIITITNIQSQEKKEIIKVTQKTKLNNEKLQAIGEITESKYKKLLKLKGVLNFTKNNDSYNINFHILLINSKTKQIFSGTSKNIGINQVYELNINSEKLKELINQINKNLAEEQDPRDISIEDAENLAKENNEDDSNTPIPTSPDGTIPPDTNPPETPNPTPPSTPPPSPPDTPITDPPSTTPPVTTPPSTTPPSTTPPSTTPPSTTPPDPNDNDEDSTRTETVQCEGKMENGKYVLREKTITYTNGNKTNEGNCVNTPTNYTVYKDYGDCSVYNNFATGKSYKQYKNYYNHPQRGRINITQCILDVQNYLSHYSTRDGCKFRIDSGNYQIIYEKRKYIVKDNARNYISGCFISTDSDATSSITNIQKEYDQCNHTVNYTNNNVTLKYKEFTLADNKKYYLSQCKTGITPTIINLYTTDKNCNYQHWINDGYSRPEERRAYTHNGKENFVENCKVIETVRYNHITNNTYCNDIVINRIVYEARRTYFTNTTKGTVIYINECQQTDIVKNINPADYLKDFEQCQINIDLVNNKAFPRFKNYLLIGEEKKYFSNCLQETTEFFEITKSPLNCERYNDLANNRSYVQKQLIYNNNVRNIAISTCTIDTTDFLTLDKDFSQCNEEFSKTNNRTIIRYFKYYYTENTRKIHVSSCLQSSTTRTVLNSDITKNYENCELSININNNTAQKRYKETLTLNRKEHIISNCLLDTNSTISLIEDYAGCKERYRPDFATNKVLFFKRYYGNIDGQNTVVLDCFETTTNTPIIKENCNTQTVIENRAYDTVSYYFTNYTNQKKFLSNCEIDPHNFQLGTERICHARFVNYYDNKFSRYNTKLVSNANIDLTTCAPSRTKPALAQIIIICDTEIHAINSGKARYKTKRSIFDTEAGATVDISPCGARNQDYIEFNLTLVDEKEYHLTSNYQIGKTNSSQESRSLGTWTTHHTNNNAHQSTTKQAIFNGYLQSKGAATGQPTAVRTIANGGFNSCNKKHYFDVSWASYTTSTYNHTHGIILSGTITQHNSYLQTLTGLYYKIEKENKVFTANKFTYKDHNNIDRNVYLETLPPTCKVPTSSILDLPIAYHNIYK